MFKIVKGTKGVTRQRFESRTEAAMAATQLAGITKPRFSERDGSNLDWKCLKRQGWAVVPARA